MSIDVEALVKWLDDRMIGGAMYSREHIIGAIRAYARLVPAEDEDACPHCGNYPGSRRWKLAHPAEDEEEGRLREWLDKRAAVPWSRGFSDEFKRGYEAAFEEFRAALAATPEPRP
jgi:hypothetical protein